MAKRRKLSSNTRPAKAGNKIGMALIETIHLLYLDFNALCYLKALIGVLQKEFDRRCAAYYKEDRG